jgi:hypothetical protein
MDIPPVDNVMRIVEPSAHNDREQQQRRRQTRQKQKIRSAPVYKANGELEDEPPPKIDVLV